MIEVFYANRELKDVVVSCKGEAFANAKSKKVLKDSISSFSSLLLVVDDISDLVYYRFIEYKRYSQYSSVLIADFELFFYEGVDSSSITIYKIKHINEYERIERRNGDNLPREPD